MKLPKLPKNTEIVIPLVPIAKWLWKGLKKLRDFFKYFLFITILSSNVFSQSFFNKEYSENDFPDFLTSYDPNEVSKIFTTHDGSTNAGFSETIGRVENPFADSFHATQSASGSRPVLGTEPEVGRRNILNFSEEFDDAYWLKTNSTITANATTAPDGTTTADKLVENSSTNQKFISENTTNYTTPTASTEHTYTIYAKNGGRPQIRVFIYLVTGFSKGVGVSFDTSTGTTFSNSAFGGFTILGTSITDVGNGWYRCRISFTDDGVANTLRTQVQINNGNSYLGNGTDGIFLWGRQLELGSSVSDYQKTVGTHESYEAGIPNRNYFWFDGTDDFLIADSLAAELAGTDTPYSIYISRKQDSIITGRNSFTLASNSSITPMLYDYTWVTNNRVEWFSRGDSGTNSTVHFGTPLTTDNQILSVVYNGSGTSTYKNGTFENNSATLRGASTFNIGTIGAYRRSDNMSGQNFWNGKIYGIYVFKKGHSKADQERVSAIMSRKTLVENIPEKNGLARIPSGQAIYDFSDRSSIFNATSGGTNSADGEIIARIEDATGNNFHATKPTSNQPTVKEYALNGNSVGNFAGGQWLEIGTQLGRMKEYTIFIVAKASGTHTGSDYGVLFASNNAGSLTDSNFVIYNTTGNDLRSGFGDNTGSSSRRITSMPKDDFFVFTTSHKDGDSFAKIWMNGFEPSFVTQTSDATSAFGNGTVYNTYIGRYNDGTNPWIWKGEIGYIIVFDTVLDFFTKRQIERFLTNKFGKTLSDINPLEIPSLKSWVDTSDSGTLYDATTGGSTISFTNTAARIEDKTSNNFHATQATAGSRPIWGTFPSIGVRNLFDRSEQFDNAYWNKAGADVTANANIAPDGTTTADTITATASDTAVVFRSDTVSGLHAWSMHFKKGTGRYVFISGNYSAPNSSGAMFDIENGTITRQDSGITASIEDKGNGWYRCSIIRNGGNRQSFFLSNSPTDEFSSTIGETMFYWGAQLEQNGSVSNYQRRITLNEIYEEELPRNFLDYSEQFNNAYWNKAHLTVSTNRTIAPDGTLTADRIVETSVTSQHYISRGSLPASSNSWSVYIKDDGMTTGKYAIFAGNTGSIVVDPKTCQITQTDGGINHFARWISNGWCRIGYTGTGTGTSIFLGLTNNPNNTGSFASYAGNTSHGLYIWGIQGEVSGAHSDYQRRVTSTDYNKNLKQRNYLLYDGSDDFLTFGTSLGKPANWHVRVVASKTSGTGRQYILGSGNDGGINSSNWGLLYQSNSNVGAFQAAFGDGVTTTSTRTNSEKILEDNTYRILSGNYTSGNNFVNLSVNGLPQVFTKGGIGAFSTEGTAFDFSLGRKGEATDFNFNGRISEAMIFDDSLPKEIEYDLDVYQAKKWHIPLSTFSENSYQQ